MEKEKNYIIYSYEIGSHVYVGLTKDMKRRDKEHRGIAYKKKDSLKNFIVENHVEMPQPKILESNLSETEAISKEDNWLNPKEIRKCQRYWRRLRIPLLPTMRPYPVSGDFRPRPRCRRNADCCIVSAGKGGFWTGFRKRKSQQR